MRRRKKVLFIYIFLNVLNYMHVCTYESNLVLNVFVLSTPFGSCGDYDSKLYSHTHVFNRSQWLNSYGDMIIIHTYIHILKRGKGDSHFPMRDTKAV